MTISQLIADSDLRIAEIGVRGLFGMYNHTVKLNQEERITIVHGPNGVGKTVFLRLTHAMLSGRYSELMKVPFKSFYVLFNTSEKIGINKLSEGVGVGVEFLFTSKGNESHKITIRNSDVNDFAKLIERESPHLRRMDADLWIDRRTDELISAADVIDRYGITSTRKFDKLLERIPRLKSIQDNFRTHFIETQRLIKFNSMRAMNRRNDRSITETVTEYSQDLQDKIEKSLADYGKESQRLDQSFPQRLINYSAPSKQMNELKENFSLIERQRDSLKRVGLLDDDSSAPQFDFNNVDINQAQQSVMTLYIEDTQKKLDTLKYLAQRVEILLNNINKKFTNKSLSISREKGLVVKSYNESILPLDALSSGEQHEIVLLYDLLFRVEKNAFVMIDEPELSLHVDWQSSFLDDLVSIIKVSQFDVLLATHSPYIVGDYTDLMVTLTAERHSVAA